MRVFKYLPTFVLIVGSLAAGYALGHDKGLENGLTIGRVEGQEFGKHLQQLHCNTMFDYLQREGVLVNGTNTHRINWDYLQVLLCDGEHAGEAP